MVPTPHPARVRPWALIGLALASVPLALLVFWPNGWSVNRLVVGLYFALGLERLGAVLPLDAPGRLDFPTLLNALLLAPLTALVMLAFPRLRWWWVALGGGAAAVAIETVQAVALPGRVASVGDVIANSTGAVAGALVGHRLNSLIARNTPHSATQHRRPRSKP